MATPAQSMAWLQANKRWFVPVAIGVPLVAAAIGFAATAVVVMNGLKGTEPFRVALEAVRASDEVTAWTGTPLEPGFIVQGSIDPPAGGVAGEANLMFSVTGPAGGAGVRAFLLREPGDDAWTLHFLDAGVTAGNDEKIVVVADTGRRPGGVDTGPGRGVGEP